MLLKGQFCPVCTGTADVQAPRCPRCRSIIQFTLEPPALGRSYVDEALVQAALDDARAQLARSLQDGQAQYSLGLCYLNMGIFDQGIEGLRRAVELMPEKHVIWFEIAMVRVAQRQYGIGRHEIEQGLRLAPENQDYRYLDHFLAGNAALLRGELRAGVTALIAAYELRPHASPAAEALHSFISAHEAKLNQPIAQGLTGLAAQDAANLKVLATNPAQQKQRLPVAPKTPRDPGKLSMNLLRRIAPARAEAVEQIHQQRVAAYQEALGGYQLAHEASAAQHQAEYSAWQSQAAAIRSDLPAMARICLAIAEEEARRKQEEQRRLAEAEQRRQAQAAAQAQQQAQKAVAMPVVRKTSREKQFLAVMAKYIEGLPVGQANDNVQIVVTNHKIVFARGGAVGGWQQVVPIEWVVDAAVETLKKGFSSERRLRISYQDPAAGLVNGIFTGLNADNAVAKIVQARNAA
jgi:tetratricopeptide (TPR) repeat protein